MSYVVDLLVKHGAAMYGHEPVTQLDHGLQTAHLAEQAGASEALIAAALLHDIGHLIGGFEHARMPDVDFAHEESGADFLRTFLGPVVSEPVRLHVAAKRWLCACDPTYVDSLSPASVHSLALQGGAFTPQAAAAFLAHPFARDAIRLRRWDDAAKVAHAPTPPLAHYARIVARIEAALA